MKKFLALFKKVGGFSVLKQYLQARVFLFAIVQTLFLGFSKKSLEILRLAVSNKVLNKLRKKYRRFIDAYKATSRPQIQTHSNKVWVCWFQGMEHAPALVQRCYRSLQENLSDREIILITQDNYRQYVTLPDYIEEKAAKGIIPKAQFSDLLRLELLIRHGGTWIDSTVFCSGSNIPKYMLNSDLFMFQTLKPGLDGHATSISNWFITACTEHPLLKLTQALLYEYWKKHNTMVDYFIFHLFFQLAIEAYPEEWNKVIPFSNATPHILLLRLFDTADKDTWQAIQEMTPFHKLSYKFTDTQTQEKGTYFQMLMERGDDYELRET